MMITKEQLHMMVTNIMRIKDFQFTEYENSFVIKSKTFKIEFCKTKWKHHLLVDQEPFNTLYYGKHYKWCELTVQNVNQILIDMRNYLDYLREYLIKQATELE